MNRKCHLIGFLLLATIAALGQRSSSQVKFVLYRMDKSCVCIRTKKNTATITASETRAGKSVYQVFWSRSLPQQELFRVEVGNYINKRLVKLWNYGIADEADLNGDGAPDYAWYGGDDSGSSMYLFLSSGSEYKQVNIVKTVEHAWTRRFHTRAPDLGDAGGEYFLESVRVERAKEGLMLLATTRQEPRDGTVSKREYEFSIKQADFVP